MEKNEVYLLGNKDECFICNMASELKELNFPVSAWPKVVKKLMPITGFDGQDVRVFACLECRINIISMRLVEIYVAILSGDEISSSDINIIKEVCSDDRIKKDWLKEYESNTWERFCTLIGFIVIEEIDNEVIGRIKEIVKAEEISMGYLSILNIINEGKQIEEDDITALKKKISAENLEIACEKKLEIIISYINEKGLHNYIKNLVAQASVIKRLGAFIDMKDVKDLDKDIDWNIPENQKAMDYAVAEHNRSGIVDLNAEQVIRKIERVKQALKS